MVRSLLLLPLFVAAIAASAVRTRKGSFSPKSWKIGAMLHDKVERRFLKGRSTAKKATAEVFTQQLDHFSGDTRTFGQRFWWNDVYYQKGGPAFLSIGGESRASPDRIEDDDSPLTKMVRDHHGIVFVLEHRFYGDVMPTSDLSASSLKYLSSRQAIEDIAVFVKSMNERFSLQSAKWIAYGGSYSGALSAWARSKHPELIYGSVASSAVVYAAAENFGFLDVVQSAITKQSPICARNVQKAFQQLGDLLKTTEGRKRVQQGLKICQSLDDVSENVKKAVFVTMVSNYFDNMQCMGVNAETCHPELTMEKLCSFHMDDGVEPFEQLANLNTYLMSVLHIRCIAVNIEFAIECMADDSLTGDCSYMRPWLWQTCTEFGFFQVPDSKSIFGGPVDLSYYADQCKGVFGAEYDAASIRRGVNSTNSFYGGKDNYKGNRVVFPNGSLDPWHANSILQTKYPDYTAIYIEGSGHISNMMNPSVNDSQSLRIARQTIEFNVATWLNQ